MAKVDKATGKAGKKAEEKAAKAAEAKTSEGGKKGDAKSAEAKAAEDHKRKADKTLEEVQKKLKPMVMGTIEEALAKDAEENGPAPVAASTEGINYFNENDVLSGRGGGTNVHPGNRTFRELM
jgi:hypothetical protein